MSTANKYLSTASLAALAFSSAVYAAAPTAVSDSRTIPVNSSITLNVISNDFDADGDAIAVVSIGTSNNATLTLNADGSIFYAPRNGFQGIDTFTYTIQEASEGALTSTATVTINIKDSDLVTVSTNENNRNLAEAMDIVCTRLRGSSDSELGAGRRNLLERCNALDILSTSNPAAANAAFQQIAPEETIALLRETSQSSRSQTAAVSQRIGQLQAGSSRFTLNGLAQDSGAGAGDAEPLWAALGFFASLQHEVARRDTSHLESGYKSHGDSVTLGADYRFNPQWVAGGAIGANQNDLDYSTQNGSLSSDITSFIIFSSYSLKHSALEVQLGYADTSFDSIRRVHYSEGNALVDDSMRASAEGSQLFLNGQWQWEWQKNALVIAPFVRVDYLQNKVDSYGETGSGGLPMVIGKQDTEQFTLGAGLQSTYTFNRNWGVFIPTLKLAMLSEINSGFDPVLSRFAYDPDPSNTFTLANDGEDSAFSQIALGSSFVFKRGFAGFLQYQKLFGYSNLSAYQIQGGIRYEF